MRIKIYILLLVGLLSLPVSLLAADSPNTHYSEAYLRNIGMHKLGAGLDVAQMQNSHIGARLCYEVGSYRHIVNGTLGVGYSCRIPCTTAPDVSIVAHHIPVFLSARLNCYRWQRNAVYVAAEGAYNIHVGNADAVQSFFSVAGETGIRLRALNIGLRYTYDLSPCYRQKFIYESPVYDFEVLHSTIYERMYVGLALTYFFSFGL